MSYVGHFFRRIAAIIADDKDELNSLKEERNEERKIEKLEAQKEKDLRDEEEAKAKAEAEQKEAEEEAANIEKETEAEAEADSSDSKGTLCFDEPIMLTADLFFSAAAFNKYFTKVTNDGKKAINDSFDKKGKQHKIKSNYFFETLEEAQAKCNKPTSMFSSKCTGIFSISISEENNKVAYAVYDEDPTLVQSAKLSKIMSAYLKKSPKFYPAYECIPEGRVLCFDPPIQLSLTKFFSDEAFSMYTKLMYRTGNQNNYNFTTLEAAKEKCQKMRNCTGILVFKLPNGDSTYMIYTGDTKLVNTEHKDYFAKGYASNNPQFLPVRSCGNVADAEERKTFNLKRLFKRAFGVTLKIIHIFLFIALGVFGASLATNLNVYRGWPYRLLYALYGFGFFFVVIPYVLVWRWFIQKKRPRFYALVPLIGSPIQNSLLATLLSWFTFEPDDEMAFLDGCRV